MNRRAFPGRAPSFLILLTAVTFVAIVLRGPIVAVAPVSDVIRHDLGLTAAQTGLFTTIPVLCFGIMTPLALLVIAKLGPDAAVTACLFGTAAGIVVRSSGGVVPALVGTVVIGAAITIGNVVVPVVLRRDVAPSRVGFATGIYTAAFNVGSALTSLATAPIADAFGWRVGLVASVLAAAAALACWSFAVGARRAFSPVRSGPVALDTAGIPIVAPRIWRSLSVVMLAAAFSGQAFSYYGVTAWLPTILVDVDGFSRTAAGAASSVFQAAAVVGALTTPMILARRGPFQAILLVGTLWMTVPLGLIFAPGLWGLWTALGGAAQGGGFTVIFVVLVRLATSDAHASRLSAVVQGVGYVAGSLAPPVLGFAHDLSGGWTAPLSAVVVSVLTLVVMGAASSLRVQRADTRRAVVASST